jgi:hypothetical protein
VQEKGSIGANKQASKHAGRELCSWLGRYTNTALQGWSTSYHSRRDAVAGIPSNTNCLFRELSIIKVMLLLIIMLLILVFVGAYHCLVSLHPLLQRTLELTAAPAQHRAWGNDCCCTPEAYCCCCCGAAAGE